MTYKIGTTYSISTYYSRTDECVSDGYEGLERIDGGKSYHSFTPRNQKDLDFMTEFLRGDSYNETKVQMFCEETDSKWVEYENHSGTEIEEDLAWTLDWNFESQWVSVRDNSVWETSGI